jgi:S-DNA-T family DNA segregation ATPase FtsK/SpoIIIE
MAKRKKRTSKKQAPKEPSMFWRVMRGVFLVVLGLLLLLGGFGTGGSLPVKLFGWVYDAFGLAGYFAPLACFYWAVHKFKHEEKVVPFRNIASMASFVIVASAWLHTGFATRDSSELPWAGGYGGAVGRTIGNALLALLDKVPTSIVFFVLTFLAFCWTFDVSVRGLFDKLLSLRRQEGDTDLDELKTREPHFKLNEGVPVEHHSQAERNSVSKNPVKNAAAALTPQEDHEALTEKSDPNWQFPSLNLLNQKQDKADAGDYETNAEIIKSTLSNFSIDVEMEEVNVGPRVTQFTLKPPQGIKLSKITALDDNLALDLAARSIRMEAPIPGKRAVGIEVPNVKPATVRLAGVIDSDAWKSNQQPLGLAVGKDIAGVPIVGSLDRMPHLLIAGQTGSGKSVMINTLLVSLLYRNSPSDLKLILVDPKQVELTSYNDIPHLLTPVITEPEKCISALKWAVAEMERRLRQFKEHGARSIAEYNDRQAEAGMPYIVIVVDEMADLMMLAGREVEALIVRIAQKARAAGIHLVLATQSPRVDVITGLIKANVPARIAFTVAGQVESRIILDQVGAEKLLGTGDMLYVTADMPKPIRVQGALIMGDEINKVTDFLRMQRPPQYDDEVVSMPVVLNGKGGIVPEPAGGGNSDSDDDMFRDAVRVVIENRKASTSLLQRRLRIGYGRASRLIDEMEEAGIVGHADGSKPREVLVSSLDDVFGGATTDVDESAVVSPEDEPLTDFEREI